MNPMFTAEVVLRLVAVTVVSIHNQESDVYCGSGIETSEIIFSKSSVVESDVYCGSGIETSVG